MTKALTLLGASTLSPHAARVHSLKNCLAVVHAVQSLLEQEVTGQARLRLTRAQDAVRRMLEVLEEDIAQDAGRTTTMHCSAEDVLEAVASRVRDRAENGGVKLVVRSGPGGVQGTMDELVEGLGNVALNAIEMTPAGSAVVIASHASSDGTQFWTVHDKGPGMSEDVIADLGRPHRSRRKGGWGLGLAVTRGIVERHGGLIRVESGPGSGTRITLCLPGSPARLPSCT